MSFLDYLLGNKKKSAAVARERLSIILAHERGAGNNRADYLPALQQELIAVISKYVLVGPDDIKVSLDRQDDVDVLEVNIVLPEVGRRPT